MEKLFLSGNEAIALGAWEAGVRVGASYPGTPATEIMEAMRGYPEMSVEWSVNEKVAVEVAYGAALTGARALASMKHVGVNVAADPVFTAAYTGAEGGLVIVTADDPGMHSSQNEQDNRNYARAAKIPMLEPSDSAEAKDFTKEAFEISEKFDIPVFLRTTTRVSHSMGVVEKGFRSEHAPKGFTPRSPKYVMVPMNAKGRRADLEKRSAALLEYSENTSLNVIETGGAEFGIICSGVVYHYVKEAFPSASILKLGVVWPLPVKKIKAFCASVKKVFIAEELDPFFETEIRALGISNVHGKDVFPSIGELSPEIVAAAIGGKSAASPQPPAHKTKIPPRPPALCPGCPHRLLYEVLSEMKLKVSGDIGCYSLGTLPPFNAMHTLLDMGAGVTMAQGMEAAMGKDYSFDTVSVIGESTFAHSGVSGLINAAFNNRRGLIIVLDNSVTAMTGMQPNPFSGETIYGTPAPALDYVKLGEAVGMKGPQIRIVDAYKKDEIDKTIRELLASRALALMVVKGPCVVHRAKKKRKQSN